jgi:hypothetical protein
MKPDYIRFRHDTSSIIWPSIHELTLLTLLKAHDAGHAEFRTSDVGVQFILSSFSSSFAGLRPEFSRRNSQRLRREPNSRQRIARSAAAPR